MSYIDEKLKIPKGVLKEVYFERIDKGIYSVKIHNPNPTSLEDWYIEIYLIKAKNQYEAKEKFKEELRTNKELNKKVRTILEQLKEKDLRHQIKTLRDIISGIEPGIWLWGVSTKAIRTLLQEEGFDTTGMTRDEMIELLRSLTPEYKEPVYLIHTKRFEEYTPEGTKIIYEKREYSDGSTKTVKIKEILLPNWEIYRNPDGIIETIWREIELVSGMWEIKMTGLDEHPNILDDREYFVSEIKRVEYKLYSEGKDPTYIQICGGRKPWDKKTKQWCITARLLPEVESGGGLKPPAVIV